MTTVIPLRELFRCGNSLSRGRTAIRVLWCGYQDSPGALSRPERRPSCLRDARPRESHEFTSTRPAHRANTPNLPLSHHRNEPRESGSGGDRMVTVWLWDADGPCRSASGVTDDDDAARAAAREGMITTGAATATVEQATHLGGGGWMLSGYSRTGTGWTARRSGDRITWSRFRRPESAAS